MVRLAGVDLASNKRIEIALTYIYGIGPSLSHEILAKANIKLGRKVKDLGDTEVLALRDVLKDYKVEGDLRREISMSI